MCSFVSFLQECSAIRVENRTDYLEIGEEKGGGGAVEGQRGPSCVLGDGEKCDEWHRGQTIRWQVEMASGWVLSPSFLNFLVFLNCKLLETDVFQVCPWARGQWKTRGQGTRRPDCYSAISKNNEVSRNRQD